MLLRVAEVAAKAFRADYRRNRQSLRFHPRPQAVFGVAPMNSDCTKRQTKGNAK